MKSLPPALARSGVVRVIGRLAAVLATLALVVALGYWAVSQRSRVVFDGESSFGRVWVVERADGLRSLYMGAGRGRQTASYPDRPMHLELAYTRVAMVGLALIPADGRILFVGLGGGAMPRYAHQLLPDAQIEVVEIDPLIVHVAQQYFAFRPDPRLVVHTGDGRAFIEQAPPATYDLIVLDAFSDDAIPFALTTRQFLEAVRSRLSPGGVLVSNLFSASGEYPSMVATYGAVFDQVRLIRVGRRTQRILVAGSARRSLDRAALVQASRILARRAELGFDLPALVERGYEGVPAVNAPVREDSAFSLSLSLSLRAPAPARARARPWHYNLSRRRGDRREQQLREIILLLRDLRERPNWLFALSDGRGSQLRSIHMVVEIDPSGSGDAMTIKVPAIAKILGGEKTLRRRLRTVAADRRRQSRRSQARRLSALHARGAAGTWAHFAEPGGARLRDDACAPAAAACRERLSAEESQRLERLARMTALAEEVWEDLALAHEFLTSSQPQLGGERPVDLARSDLGTREVETLLYQLEYSLPV